MKPKIESDV